MGISRTMAERLGRGRVVKRKLWVNGRSVSLFVSPDAQLKYLKPGRGAFDSDLIALAEGFVGAKTVAWDIGANVGVFTFAAAAMATEGVIVSAEADAWLATIVRRSTRLPMNADRDIRVIPVAVSDEDGVGSFLIAKRGRASNALEQTKGRSQMGGVRERQMVPTLRLDTILASLPAPDFVKVDVEGAELGVVRGAERLIREVRPIFYIEVGPSTSDEVFALFKAAGYRGFAPDGQPLTNALRTNSLLIHREDEDGLAKLRRFAQLAA